MDASITENVINFIKKNTLAHMSRRLNVNLFGGEPLLNIQSVLHILSELETWTEENSIHFCSKIFSGGTLFTKKLLNKLHMIAPNLSFPITLDGPRQIHDKKKMYKNGVGTYEDIMDSIGLIKSIYGLKHVGIRINLDRKNFDHIEELLNDLEARKFQEIPLQFAAVEPKSKTCQNYSPFCLSFQELTNIMPKIWDTTLKRGFLIKNFLLRYSGECEYSTDFAYVIDPFGDVYKCVDLVGQKEHCIGTINNVGEISHLKPPYYGWMSRNPLTIVPCQNCSLLPECRGGCGAIAYRKHGTYNAPGCGYDRYFANTLRLFLANKKATRLVAANQIDQHLRDSR